MSDVRLIHGDCLEVMGGLQAGSIDLILTSPPYDNLRSYGGHASFDFEGIASHCRRVLKTGGVLVWVVGDETRDGDESGTSFRQALHFKSIGLKLHDTMIYRKSNPMHCGSKNRYVDSFDFMFVFSIGPPAKVRRLDEPCVTAGRVNDRFGKDHGIRHVKSNAGRPVRETKPRSNVWDYPVGPTDRRYRDHPAVFPLRLATDHILSWTDPGDLVLDPFVGSGTTLEASLGTGRRGIGIEKYDPYFAIAERRIAEARAATPLFDATA